MDPTGTSRAQLKSDPAEITHSLGLLFEPGDVVEIRIPKTEREGVVSGYFSDHGALAKVLAARNGDVGVYVTMNPANPALLARSANHVRSKARVTTSDHDIATRRWLLVDCDPVRPAEISASDEEHETALERARDIARVLREELGLPEPILADSGNGAHLLYRINLPNDEASANLLRRVLRALAARFDDSAVKIDQTVHNAARILKAYGTVTRKGDNLPERPHRISRIIAAPSRPEVVSRELLEELARPVQPMPASAPTDRWARTLDVGEWILRHGLSVREPVEHEGGWKWVLPACPFNADHQAPDAAIFQSADGRPGFKCFHASCASYGWRELRQKVEGPQSRRPQRPEVRKPQATDDESSSTTDEPTFPESAWRGLFADYRTAMQGTTEACDAAHFATFWAAVAVILGRKVEMYAGDVVYPNVYVAVFGETGDKKTTAERRISSCNLLEHWPHIRLVRGEGSTEGIADDVADSETGVYLFMWEEFATFLSQARWAGSTLLEFFTQCFDCPSEWNRNYRKKSIHLEIPTPSILTATTAEWFWKHARTEDFFGGIFNRFLFFTGARKALLPNPNIVDGEAIARIKEHLKIVADRVPCRANWTTDAKKTFDAFYVKFESAERSSLLRAATKRAHVYVRKLAMTYAALEQTLPHIDADQLEAAIAVVKHVVACTERLLDLQAAQSKPQGELEQKFLKWVKRHEGEEVRRMHQLMWKYCGDSETFNRTLRSMVIADQIEIRDKKVYLST
jgi:hypothetical protein